MGLIDGNVPRPLLTIHVTSDGQIGVTGPIDDVPMLLDILGKAMIVLAGHHQAKKNSSGLVVARPMPDQPQVNGNSHPPLRRV